MVSDNMPNQVRHHNNADQITSGNIKEILGQWWAYLLSKWILLLLVGISGGVLGLVYAYYAKPIYKATTTFVLEEGGKSGGGALGQYAGLASMAGLDMNGGSGGIFQGENILELYKSRLMLQKALLSNIYDGNKKELLIDKYIEVNDIRKGWANKPALKNIDFNLKEGQRYSRIQDSVLGKVVQEVNKNYLTVGKPDKKLSIIEVSVKANNEFFAEKFDSCIVETVNNFYVQTKTKKSLQNLAVLQHQTDSVKSVLNGAIFQAVAVNDATPNLNLTKQILRAPSQRSQFSVEANKAILSQLVQNLELAKLTLRQETPLIQVIDKPILPLDVAKVRKITAATLGAIGLFFFTSILLILKKIFKGK